MKRHNDPSRLLRWYPRRWRERYGDEFSAFLNDSLADRKPTLAFRVSIAAAGLRERAHDASLLGDASSPAQRVRAGALLVLSAWAVYAVAGASFSKLSEHFNAAVPATSRAVPWAAFRTVQVLAVLAALVVIVGAAVAIPAFLRFLRDGGWPTISRYVLLATGAAVVAALASAGLVAWASSLSFAQRNGGDGLYAAGFLAWAVLLATTLGLWTFAAVAVSRKLVLAPSVLSIEALLAGALTTAMVAMTTATAVWWAAIATNAPWFLHGARPASSGSAFEPRLAMTLAVMIGAVVAASFGTVRIARSWNQLRVTCNTTIDSH